MGSAQRDVTALLSQLTQGNQQAAEELIPLVYDELRRLARRQMRRERRDHTLQTTALVHEAYLKLVHQKATNWQGRAHFFGIAGQVMRRILIDYARGHLRQKRGEKLLQPLDEGLTFSPQHSARLVKLDEALDRLSKIDSRQGQIVELRFFGVSALKKPQNFSAYLPKPLSATGPLPKVGFTPN